MKEAQFKRHIESTRNCDAVRLDIAINKGLLRAKNERLDFNKIINLVTMCAVTAVICITVSRESVMVKAEYFILNNSLVTQSSSEELYGYLNSISNVLTTYLRGD